MLPWYAQIGILLGITVILYPILVIIYLKYFFLNSLCKSVLDEVFKKQEEKDLEGSLAKVFEVPEDENPLISGECAVENGLIVRKDDESKFEW